MKWYYAKDGQQIGPIEPAELANLVSSGLIQGSTLVWKEGMPQWIPYQQAWQEGMPDWRKASSFSPTPPSLGAGAAPASEPTMMGQIPGSGRGPSIGILQPLRGLEGV